MAEPHKMPIPPLGEQPGRTARAFEAVGKYAADHPYLAFLTLAECEAVMEKRALDAAEPPRYGEPLSVKPQRDQIEMAEKSSDALKNQFFKWFCGQDINLQRPARERALMQMSFYAGWKARKRVQYAALIEEAIDKPKAEAYPIPDHYYHGD